jgi:hypothetical protein
MGKRGRKPAVNVRVNGGLSTDGQAGSIPEAPTATNETGNNWTARPSMRHSDRGRFRGKGFKDTPLPGPTDDTELAN